MAERQASPSEQTPLLEAAPEDDSNSSSISFFRGLGVVAFMGLLVFVQCESELCGCNDELQGRGLISRFHSNQHVYDDNCPIRHCRRLGCFRRGNLVHVCIHGMILRVTEGIGRLIGSP